MILFLQMWGGIGYLFNKIFFMQAERRRVKTGREKDDYDDVAMIRMTHAWRAYLISVWPWLIILFLERNWIVMATEAGGIPSMMFGYLTFRSFKKKKYPRLKRFAAWSTYGLLAVGVAFSIYDQGLFKEITQIAEVGSMSGFLLGTFLLARSNSLGYVFLAIMNSATAWLMYLQEYYWLCGQQVASLFFIVIAFHFSRR